jgi:uncharacterized protein
VRRLHQVLWLGGWPLRVVLIGLIRLYRWTLSGAFGGGCRFHPSCSAYAERAVRNAGAVRGSVLTVWRLARCSPLSHGGIDVPPEPRERPFVYELALRHPTQSALYDAVVQDGNGKVRA